MATALTEITVARADKFDEAWELLQEYFEAVQVVVRDEAESVSKYLEDGRSGIWLAYCNGEAAGCIALRPLSAKTGEVKRLWVRPHFRRMGIASRLLTALEDFSASIGMQTLYLDSKDDLEAAVTFYERSGYRRCQRYNDNPQATIFLRKTLTSPIEVGDFRAGDEDAFWSLNEAWISKLFQLEEKDIQTLREPQKYILAKGGRIYIARNQGVAVGCCALLQMGDGVYEVAKMGVAEAERGKGVGRRMLQHVIEQARLLGIRRLYLETNHTLENAIHLYESVGFIHIKPEDVTTSPYRRADVYMDMTLS